MSAREINFDGLVGPTHHHAGLVRGDVATPAGARGSFSNPRKAARQGLAKMKWLADLGVPQAIFPPQERPCLGTLRAFGFSGTDAQVLRAAAKHAPELLAAVSTASCMWVAHAATIAPSSDTADGRVHITAANLAGAFHRSIETAQNIRTLRAIFRDEGGFELHPPLPGGGAMNDDGAANHTRLAPSHERRGLHLFVYGRSALAPAGDANHAVAQQALEASCAVARLQRLPDTLTCFARQTPVAFQAGATHGDALCVGNENIFICHEQAFVDTSRVLEDLKRRYVRLRGGEGLVTIQVPASRISIEAALNSNVFNSQVVTLAPGQMALIAPIEAEGVPAVRAFLQSLIDSQTTPIREVRYFDLREAMRSGGGPACLRLRAVLTDEERELLPPGMFLDEALYVRLNAWIRKNYRDKVTVADLADPMLLEESRRALDELTRLLGLGSIYPFQQV